ncbi:MAG: serine/threonine protein kinase [Deltaproteobacteria bacterium]|nr:serine/threonine protein kinase [Deltaproteobacteria bacterium]
MASAEGSSVPDDLGTDTTQRGLGEHPGGNPTETLRGEGGALPWVGSLPPVDLVRDLERAEGHDLVLREELARGGMGVVWLASQPSLDREVAVKLPRDDLGDSAVAALAREARLLGVLEHPGVVPVHAFGRTPEGTPALVMKRVTGVRWRELLQDGAHPRWEKHPGDRRAFHVGVLREVAQTVEFAHSRGIVHRDLKSENVMLGDFGEVYVLDWGIAVREGSPETERDDEIVGTPAYMAPEMVLRALGKITTRTDVFLLGALLHELLTGHPPHRGDTVLTVLAAARRGAVLEYGPEVPSELGELCRRAMHREPSERPDARAFREALEAWVAHRASAALAQDALGRVEPLLAREPSAVAGAPTESAAARKVLIASAYGFDQALKGWPENTEAQAARRQTLTWWARFEVARGDADAAAALAADLDPAPDGLYEALAALRAQQAHAAADLVRLRRMTLDSDVRMHSAARARASLTLALPTAMIPLGLTALHRHQGLELTHRLALSILGAVSLLSVFLTWRFRKVFLANRASRQIVAMAYLALVGVCVCVAVGALTKDPLAHSASPALVSVTMVFGSMTLTVDRRFLGVALVTGVGAALATLYEGEALEVVAVAGALSSLGLWWLFRSLAAARDTIER